MSSYRAANDTVYSAKYHLIGWPKYRPPVALSRFVQMAKGGSARLLPREVPRLRRLALWSPSWFVSTVGGEPLEVVRRYVENQKQTP